MAESIFTRTFADESPERMVDIKTLATLGYSVTVKRDGKPHERYKLTLVHPGGKKRKRFAGSVLENIIESAMYYAKQYDDQMRGTT